MISLWACSLAPNRWSSEVGRLFPKNMVADRRGRSVDGSQLDGQLPRSRWPPPSLAAWYRPSRATLKQDKHNLNSANRKGTNTRTRLARKPPAFGNYEGVGSFLAIGGRHRLYLGHLTTQSRDPLSIKDGTLCDSSFSGLHIPLAPAGGLELAGQPPHRCLQLQYTLVLHRVTRV